MSSFLYRLGQRCARHPWRVVGVWLLIALAVLGLNYRLGGSTKDNFTVPGVEAQRATDLLNDHFPEFSGRTGTDRVPRRRGQCHRPAERRSRSASPSTNSVTVTT